MKIGKKILLLTASAVFLLHTAAPAFGAEGWRQENGGQWYYYGGDGQRRTGWVEDQGNWYYLEPSGQMASNTVKVIDGISYEFDGSGVWRERGSKGDGGTWAQGSIALGTSASEYSAQSGTWTSDTAFVNSWSGLILEFPAGYTNEAYDGEYEGWLHDFSVCSPEGDLMFQAVYKDMGKTAGENEVKQLMEEYKGRLTTSEGYSFSSFGQAVIGGRSYQKATFHMADSLTKEVYMRPVGNHIMILETLYFKGRGEAVSRILKAE